MFLFDMCAPAFIYLMYSSALIVIDVSKHNYNTALFKTIVTGIMTYLLVSLCKNGYSIISWIIVFVPFIFMSVITMLSISSLLK